MRTDVDIQRVDSRSFELKAPVLVVGAGACGLSAALSLRDCGVEALVLERDSVPSGSTAMSYGAICAAGTQQQQDLGIDDSAVQLRDDILAITQGQTDPELAALIAAEAGRTVEWLTDKHNIRLTLEATWTGMGHQVPRLHAPRDRSGKTLMNMLMTAAEQAEVDIVTSARVVTLFADADDRVLGAAVARPGGEIEEIGCDALVLATCGFGADRDMVRQHMPAVGNARYFGHEGNTGDGIRWGKALGAATADMGAYQALGSLADPQSIVIPHTLMIGGGYQVNTAGERFENELENISGQALTILEQPDGVCWIVYDERLHDAAMERFEEYRDATQVSAMKTATSFAELAAATGLPAEALARTSASVAAFAHGESADPFEREFSTDELLRSPYYAIRVTGALFHTQGGLVVDGDARVLRENGEALPNLFAGGGTARSVSGPGEWGYLPGMGLCMAVTLGRLAGAGAARLVPQ